MIFLYKELLLKYSNYKNPKDKIKREIDKGTYYKVKKGLYEDNLNVNGYLLAGIIESLSYISFEYALSKYGLIPERVVNYTCATTLKKHNRHVKNIFGEYFYTDVPIDVWSLGVKYIVEDEYSYLIATKEKALCDLLYKKPPVNSIKGLKELLFEDLRIDKDMFNELNFEDITSVCDLYKKKNLKLLKKMLEKGNVNE